MKRTRRTDARLLHSWSYLVGVETGVTVFWMRFRQVPCVTTVDHFTLFGRAPNPLSACLDDWGDIVDCGHTLRLSYVSDDIEELRLQIVSSTLRMWNLGEVMLADSLP